MPDEATPPQLLPRPVPSFVGRVLERALTAEGFTAIAAVFGVATLVAVIGKFGLSPLVAVFGTVLAILLAILFICFSWVSKIRRKHRSVLSGILAYTVVLMVCASIVLCFVSTFFDAPLPLKSKLVELLGTQKDARVFVTEKADAAVARSTRADRIINRIIICETMTPPGTSTIRLADFISSHIKGGGYHFLVDRSGLVYPMADVAEVVAHTSFNNDDSIGIGLEHALGEKFMAAQLGGLEKLLAGLSHRLKIDPENIISKVQINPSRYRGDLAPLLPGIRAEVRKQMR
jgi:hypothetical protein